MDTSVAEEKKITITGTNNRYQVTKLKKEEKMISKRKTFGVGDVNKKLSGYKQQDIKKGRFNSELFISLSQLEDLFSTSKMKCFFCLEETMLIYEKVREPKQWTLDRIDNEVGHNINNFVMCCLSCNLRRRRTNKDAFLFTTNLIIKRENY